MSRAATEKKKEEEYRVDEIFAKLSYPSIVFGDNSIIGRSVDQR